MKLVFGLLTMDQVRKIHDASLAVLARTGMRFGSTKFLKALLRGAVEVPRDR